MMQERGNVIAAQCLGVAELRLLQAQRAGPGAILVFAKELFAIGFKGGGRQIGGKVIDFGIAEHERVLDEDGVFPILYCFGLHGLRDPVGIGELLERVGMGVFQNGDRVDFQRLAANIGHVNITHFNAIASRDKDRDFGAQTVHLADDSRVAKADAAFVFSHRGRGWGQRRGRIPDNCPHP